MAICPTCKNPGKAVWSVLSEENDMLLAELAAPLPAAQPGEPTHLIADMVHEWGNRGEKTSLAVWDARCKAVIARMRSWLNQEPSDGQQKLCPECHGEKGEEIASSSTSYSWRICDTCDGTGIVEATVPSTLEPASATPRPLADWNDPTVQKVSYLLATDDLDHKPDEDHGEGYCARAIVALCKADFERELAAAKRLLKISDGQVNEYISKCKALERENATLENELKRIDVALDDVRVNLTLTAANAAIDELSAHLADVTAEASKYEAKLEANAKLNPKVMTEEEIAGLCCPVEFERVAP